MRRRLTVTLIGGLLLACLPVNVRAEEPIVFLDSKMFDKSLRGAMRQDHKLIEVEFLDPPSPNDLPERFGAWLSAVQKRGGSVALEPTERPRGAEVAAVQLGVMAAKRIRKKRLFRPAGNYDVLLYYDHDSGMIERAVFTRQEN